MNKATYARIEKLSMRLSRELQGFQLGQYLSSPEFGIIDLPLFGLRFKTTDAHLQDDNKFHIVPIPNEEYLDCEDLLVLLAARGYLHWLRTRLNSHTFFTVLSFKERWKTLIELALSNVIENNRGEYLQSYYEELLRKPLMQIYQEDQTAFDWMILS